MSDRPTVIVHFQPDGWIDYLRTEGVRLLIVDERVPNDRVYEYPCLATEADIAAVIGDSNIGNDREPRHAAIANRIIAAIEGRPHLALAKVEAET